MVTKVQKWGNSQGLRLPKHVLESVGIAVGEDVEVSVQEGAIVVVPARRIRHQYDLKELVSRIPDDYAAQEEPWGKPVGKEEW